ncbi:hypothetical protein CEUSTIGMA_g7040.t1 [Chlamydomonas eustigma]|uniref:Small ribosomal subunit protein mS35 mitochondrial conserved domain-containing protein n=1 Tax=Chlamydomonas eustigma TaxID=1157962 RepID=A0A250X9N0_9CHLO|nr:hypothetical protein CEUSTIGMA_g7040.t1 [Chlamydomonas eustigma]|eukprot:GAX79599.1 hypothetical protein CEUSTIGMA_g7040.t1 [Chlamydomonas eustigma]
MAPGSHGSLGVKNMLLSFAPLKGSLVVTYQLYGQNSLSKRYASGAVAQQKPSKLISRSEDGNPSQEAGQIRAALSPFLPDEQMVETYRTNKTPRIRFSDIPANSKLIESFASSKLPTQPLYDLPNWLEHNYPQYDASPKSPFYSWITWMREHLPRNQQRTLAAFHAYMQSSKHRLAILEQSNYELARLWHWQHQRAAMGLPPELTPDEVQAAAFSHKHSADSSSSGGTSSGVAMGDTSSGSSVSSQLNAVQEDFTAAGSAASVALSGASSSSSAAKVAPVSSSSAAKVAPASAQPPKGILGLIHQAEKKQQLAQEDKQERLADHGLVDLTPEQREVVSTLKNPARELRELAASFEERRIRGEENLRRQSKMKELLLQEFEERSAAVAEAAQLGLDHQEVLNKVQLYESEGGGTTKESSGSSGDTKAAGAAAQKLRKLQPRDLKMAVQGHKYWTETRLLDHRANVQELATQVAKLEESLAQMKLADESFLKTRQGHGYTFSLLKQPPTPTLDMLTKYYQLKYMDVLIQKEEAHNLRSSSNAALSALSAKTSGSSTPSSNQLSPSEVHDINRRASEAFNSIADTADTGSYSQLMAQLYGQGLISKTDLDEGLLAARLRAAEARVESKKSQIAALLEGTALEGNDISMGVKQTLSSQLLGVLHGHVDSPLTVTSPVSHLQQNAKKLWEDAASSGFGPWAKSIKESCRRDIEKRRSAGENISAEQELELLTMWDQPVSFKEAQQVWNAYLNSAGMAHGPQLEEVLHLDQQMRKTSVGDRVNEGPSEDLAVTALTGQLKEVFECFKQKHGSVLMGGNDLKGEAFRDLEWSEVQEKLRDLDVTSVGSLEGIFQSASLRQVLGEHWRRIVRQLLPEESSSSSSSSEEDEVQDDAESSSKSAASEPPVSSFEDLWTLMSEVFHSSLSSVKQGPSPAVASTATLRADLDTVGGSSYRLAGFSPASSLVSSSTADASASPQGLSDGATQQSKQLNPGEAGTEEQDRNLKQSWDLYTREQAGSIIPTYVSSYGTLPYPLAQPILRFSQKTVLGPTASTSATSSATPGLMPSGAGIDVPSSNRDVCLRVRAADLASEAGLGEKALSHILQICGPERFESSTGDIVLRADRYPSREENRRLCLEQLHLLLKEGQAKESSVDFLFSKQRSSYLSELEV